MQFVKSVFIFIYKLDRKGSILEMEWKKFSEQNSLPA